MPGADVLTRELGVGRNTVDAALIQLEREGMLRNCGAGRRRRVVAREVAGRGSLRVRILSYSVRDQTDVVIQDLHYRLGAGGHAVRFSGKTLQDLKMDARRVAAHVEREPADAWVVYGASKEILAWFAEGPVPAYALVGRMRGVAIAGVKPDKGPAQQVAIRRLVELGHSRIVRIVRPERVQPVLGMIEMAFLEDLESHGIRTGSYNMAVWHGGAADFRGCLDSLFRLTPPTALFLDEPMLFLAARQHLAGKGLLAPQNVSLICDDPDPYFGIFDPPISHIAWKSEDLARQAARWVNRIAGGHDERRQSFVKATFVEGGTIGPAPAARGAK
jgi:DNA-binding LacI/PurR family transcriptional regulator